jgi:hypothetical protein
VWEALEDNVEEDDEIRDGQTTQRNIVQGDEARSRRGKTFVEEDEGELNGPERGNVERRSRDDHLHYAFEILWGY